MSSQGGSTLCCETAAPEGDKSKDVNQCGASGSSPVENRQIYVEPGSKGSKGPTTGGSGAGGYCCKFCKKQYNVQKSLENHLSSKHGWSYRQDAPVRFRRTKNQKDENPTGKRGLRGHPVQGKQNISTEVPLIPDEVQASVV